MYYGGPLAPVPDNSDKCSTVSFNTSLLYDNLESISQTGGNTEIEDHPVTASLDLKDVQIEIQKKDRYIGELMTERIRLKNLLKKAKTAIDSVGAKYK